MILMDDKLYVLFDWTDNKLIKASFDREEVLAKAGEDFLSGIDTESYCLKSVRIEDMKDEINIDVNSD